jgi:hypothetical protein
MKTTVTITQHYPVYGESNGRAWVRNDFKFDDGQKFQTFDADLASQVKSLMHRPVELEYEPQERGQYVNNDIKAVTPAGDAPATAPLAAAATPEIQPVDRNAGLARAIEFLSVAGENPLKAFDNGTLFELADTFAEYGALGAKPSAATEAVA